MTPMQDGDDYAEIRGFGDGDYGCPDDAHARDFFAPWERRAKAAHEMALAQDRRMTADRERIKAMLELSRSQTRMTLASLAITITISLALLARLLLQSST